MWDDTSLADLFDAERVERVAQAVAEQVDGEHREQDHQAGEDRLPRRAALVGQAVGQRSQRAISRPSVSSLFIENIRFIAPVNEWDEADCLQATGCAQQRGARFDRLCPLW